MTKTIGVVDDEFLQQADPYRRELLAHCYRMLGSVHDAEDLVQETLLRAWKAYDRFEGRSSLRTWLHTIATRACLTAIEAGQRRPLPTGLGGPNTDPEGDLTDRSEVPWLEPIPDSLLAGDPATVVVNRESLRLALIAALQHLPARQRAVLILRDVLAWKAAEVAELLGTTTAAVNSMLQRAHAQIDEAAPTPESVTEPTEPAQRELLDRYVAAFEANDYKAITELFAEDAVWEMPPFLDWFRGGQHIGQLIEHHCPAKAAGDMRLLPTQANGQPAFGLYMRTPEGDFEAFNLPVLTLGPNGVTHVVAFFDVRLFDTFGLPRRLPSDPPTS